MNAVTEKPPLQILQNATDANAEHIRLLNCPICANRLVHSCYNVERPAMLINMPFFFSFFTLSRQLPRILTGAQKKLLAKAGNVVP